MSQARGTVSVDDDRVRVTTWTFEAAGIATGRHRHEFDYVDRPDHRRDVHRDRPRRVRARAGAGRGRSPYLGTAGTEHDVVSATDRQAVFVEIELKR